MFIIISSIEKAFLVIVCVVKDILFLVTDSWHMVRCNMEGKPAPCIVGPRGLFSANDTNPVCDNWYCPDVRRGVWLPPIGLRVVNCYEKGT